MYHILKSSKFNVSVYNECFAVLLVFRSPIRSANFSCLKMPLLIRPDNKL